MNTVLYDYWRSSAAYRLRIAFGLLGMDYTARPVDLLTGEHKGEANITRNPQGLVPTVEIDGQTLTQSLAVLEYLDETRQAGFLPEGAADRAKVRAMAYAVAMEIHPVCNLSVAKYASEHSGGEITMKGWMHQWIGPRLEALETMIAAAGRGKFCFGDTVTLADICLVPQMYNADRWEVDTAHLPRINAAMSALNRIEAVAAAHPDRVKPA